MQRFFYIASFIVSASVVLASHDKELKSPLVPRSFNSQSSQPVLVDLNLFCPRIEDSELELINYDQLPKPDFPEITPSSDSSNPQQPSSYSNFSPSPIFVPSARPEKIPTFSSSRKLFKDTSDASAISVVDNDAKNQDEDGEDGEDEEYEEDEETEEEEEDATESVEIEETQRGDGKH